MDSSNVHETTIRVRYADTDQMGVAYHSNYLIWFEVARAEAFRDFGLPYLELEEKNITLPVIECYCKFKSGATYDQLIVVQTHVVELTRAKLSIGYRVLAKEERKELASGGTIHVFVDKQGKILRMNYFPDEWERLQKIARLLPGNEAQSGKRSE